MASYSGFSHKLKIVIFHCYVSLPEGKPPMTGNSDYIIYKNGDDWELVQMALVYP